MKATQERERGRVMSWRENGTNRTTFNRGDTLSGCLLSCVKNICLGFRSGKLILQSDTAVSSGAWAKLRDWASVAGRGRLLLSGSVAHASLKSAVLPLNLVVPLAAAGTSRFPT